MWPFVFYLKINIQMLRRKDMGSLTSLQIQSKFNVVFFFVFFLITVAQAKQNRQESKTQ